jgi:hypothetical protein
MSLIRDYEFIAVLTDKEGVGRPVDVYPFPEEFMPGPVATSGKNQRANGDQAQRQEPFS